MDRRAFLTATGAGVLACTRRRRSGFSGFAFVANEEGQAVAVVDLAAFAVTKHIRLGASPTAVISDARRNTIYALTPATGTVHELRLNPLSVSRQKQVASSATMMLAAADGESLWLLCRAQRRLVRLDLPSFEIGAALTLPEEPSSFDVGQTFDNTANQYRPVGVVGLGTSGQIAVFDPRQPSLFKLMQLGGEVGTVVLRGDGRQAVVANLGRTALSLARVSDGALVTHLPLALRPEHFCTSADGGQIFVTGPGADAVAVVEPYRTQVAATLLAGHAPGAMAASQSPDYLFLTNPASGEVTILDIATRRVIAVAPVGADPGYIAITPGSEYALVLNRKSGDMAVLHIPAISAKRSKRAGLFTMIPVGSRPVSAAIRDV